MVAPWREKRRRKLAYEALARALAANGDLNGARSHIDRARELTEAVADEGDRSVPEGELARGPWFGLEGLSPLPG